MQFEGELGEINAEIGGKVKEKQEKKRGILRKFLASADIFHIISKKTSSGSSKEKEKERQQDRATSSAPGFQEFYSVFVRLNNVEFARLKVFEIHKATLQKLGIAEEEENADEVSGSAQDDDDGNGSENWEKPLFKDIPKLRWDLEEIFYSTSLYLKQVLNDMVSVLVDSIEEEGIEALKEGLGNAMTTLSVGETSRV